jgi:beta-galactosidase/beta-glucuronidase
VGKKHFDKKLHATLLSEGVETPAKLDLSVSFFVRNFGVFTFYRVDITGKINLRNLFGVLSQHHQ